jgi:hypothetical protein
VFEELGKNIAITCEQRRMKGKLPSQKNKLVEAMLVDSLHYVGKN